MIDDHDNVHDDDDDDDDYEDNLIKLDQVMLMDTESWVSQLLDCRQHKNEGRRLRQAAEYLCWSPDEKNDAYGGSLCRKLMIGVGMGAWETSLLQIVKIVKQL